MPEGEYEVVIDATLEDGSLTYAECVIPGQTEDEILLSAHICHIDRQYSPYPALVRS